MLKLESVTTDQAPALREEIKAPTEREGAKIPSKNLFSEFNSK